jgi:hypothetical protein
VAGLVSLVAGRSAGHDLGTNHGPKLTLHLDPSQGAGQVSERQDVSARKT